LYHYQRCASYSGTFNCPKLLLTRTRDSYSTAVFATAKNICNRNTNDYYIGLPVCTVTPSLLSWLKFLLISVNCSQGKESIYLFPFSAMTCKIAFKLFKLSRFCECYIYTIPLSEFHSSRSLIDLCSASKNIQTIGACNYSKSFANINFILWQHNTCRRLKHED